MGKRFVADEVCAGGLIGCVKGQYEIDRWTGFAVPSAIDWDSAVFCREWDDAGEPVELCDADRNAITQAVTECLSRLTDPHFGSVRFICGTKPAFVSNQPLITG